MQCMQMIRAADAKTRPQVLEILDSAKDLGLKVLRIWAFSEGPIQYNTLQRYPGAALLFIQYCHQQPHCLMCSRITPYTSFERRGPMK